MTFTTIDSSLVPAFLPLFKYRRSNLLYLSSTLVGIETGLNGIAGQGTVLFPDGSLLFNSSTNQIQMNIGQNAVFTSPNNLLNQGGLRTGSAVANTWYACYAVKVTTFPLNWVLVADTVFPIQANYSTLNTNFNTNGWVYLGLIRYGDTSANTTSILNFRQTGNFTYLYNLEAAINGAAAQGMRLAANNATAVTWTYASGSNGAVVPGYLQSGLFWVGTSNSGTNAEWSIRDSGANFHYLRCSVIAGFRDIKQFWGDFQSGVRLDNANPGSGQDINLVGWIDPVLGVGSNPLV